MKRPKSRAHIEDPPPVALGAMIPVLLAGLSMLGPFSIDTPFPAYTEMGAALAGSGNQLQWVVSAYLIAFGVMSPFHGPLSDALGRRRIIIGGVAIYVLASIGCAFAGSIEVLLAFRVLQGLSAGGGVIVSRTVIRDVYDGAQAQRLMSRVMMIFGVSPAAAPIIGGLLLQMAPWPVIFVFMAAIGIVLIAAVLIWLPETHPRALRTPFALGPLLASLGQVARSARFHQVTWAAALCFSGQFLYVGSAPIFVVGLLGKGELDFWMFFVPMIAGIMVGSTISARAAGHVSSNRLVTLAVVFAVAGGAINVGLGALPTAAQLPWAVIGPALIAVGTATAYPTQQLLLLDMFPRARGAAVSLFTFLTLVLNGVIAVALAPLVTDSVLTMAVAALGLVLLGASFWTWHLLQSKVE